MLGGGGIKRMTVTIIIAGIFMSLSRIVVFLVWSLFSRISRMQTVACLRYSRNDFIGSYFIILLVVL